MTDQFRFEEKNRKWTPEEDERLKAAYAEFGSKSWTMIAEKVGTRNTIQCLRRWTSKLKPGLVHGPWTKEEDDIVIQWVATNGQNLWKQCAEELNGTRSRKQCRERWFSHLSPAVQSEKWTHTEDEILCDRFNQHGPNWRLIATDLPGHSESSLKRRYTYLERRGKVPPDTEVCQLDEVSQALIQTLCKIYKFQTALTEISRCYRVIDGALEEEEEEDAASSQQI